MARNVGRPAVGRAPPMSFFLTSAWAQETGASSSVPLNQGTWRYTQDLMITPRAMKTIGALLTIIDDYAPHNENYRGFID